MMEILCANCAVADRSVRAIGHCRAATMCDVATTSKCYLAHSTQALTKLTLSELCVCVCVHCAIALYLFLLLSEHLIFDFLHFTAYED